MERRKAPSNIQGDEVGCLSEDLVSGNGLWRVGFSIESLSLIRYLSGLVSIVSVFWNEDDNVLILIVRNKDISNVLFRSGILAAQPIKQYKVSQQGIVASFTSKSIFQEVH